MTHHLGRAECREEAGKHEIHQASAEHTYAGVRERLRLVEAFCQSHLHHGRIAPQKSK